MFLHCHEQVCISAISDARIQSGGWGLARQMHECTIGGLVGIQQFPPAMKWDICAYILDAPQTTRSSVLGLFLTFPPSTSPTIHQHPWSH